MGKQKVTLSALCAGRMVPNTVLLTLGTLHWFGQNKILNNTTLTFPIFGGGKLGSYSIQAVAQAYLKVNAILLPKIPEHWIIGLNYYTWFKFFLTPLSSI